MTRKNTLDAASLTHLMKAANAVQLAHDHLVEVTLEDVGQLDLFEAGADQACEDFVAEREELKAQLAEANEGFSTARHELFLAKEQLRQELESSRVYTQGLRSEIERLSDELVQVSNAYHRRGEDIQTANAVLTHIADYANQLQGRLNSIGISYRADDETGEPRITVNIATLGEALRDMIDRS